MIVGNGPVPEGADAVIDAADFVIRFNDCRSFGRAGQRTDVIAVCNTGRPARNMIGSETWRDSAPVVACSQIWSVRDPEKFEEMRRPLVLSHPELDDFCDDYTEAFRTFAEGQGKVHEVIDRRVHEAMDAALSAHQPPPYVVPSSGMVVIGALLDNPAYGQDAISIAGFSHEGWDGHPFAAEKRLVEAYVAQGSLHRLG
ncbi:Urease operon accessory protein [Rhizobium sp. CG5]|uniref:Urease operon accessory protein n=1 Tax=Rhizobium sp. CG5 TaxID=2726076 RepID=UPI0020346208|nr:Urease operon accessory protein [Rhizobium sp. CG5]MCM2473218.1 Urease operon accessory protein [Rhizobium sp. CG5]